MLESIYNDIISPDVNLIGAITKLVLSLILGATIGIERRRKGQIAGLRTFALISMGATLAMLISIYIPQEYLGLKNGDPGRIAAQVVSGVGFLGAGAIIQMKGSVRGLTTAAGIWMTAGIGLAIGAGMYVVTGCTVVLIWILQYAFYRIPFGVESYDGYHLQFVVKGDEDFETILRKQLKEWNAQITENTINWQRDDKVEFDCTILRVDEIKYSDVKKFVDENESIVSFSYSPVKTHVQ